MNLSRILLILLGIVVLVIVSALTYIKIGLPNIPLKEVAITASADRIENGKYLANNVMVCMDCHSTRDGSKFSAPLVDGTLGKGGELFDQAMGFPGRYISKNLTPFNLANWSDAELFRVITRELPNPEMRSSPSCLTIITAGWTKKTLKMSSLT